MTHFSIKIQQNQTDPPSKMKIQGEANAALQQMKQQQEQQYLQLE